MSFNLFLRFLKYFLNVEFIFLSVMIYVISVSSNEESDSMLSDIFVDGINAAARGTWQTDEITDAADSAAIRTKKWANSSNLRGIGDNEYSLLPFVNHTLQLLPQEFDSRVRWPFCSSIREISDQASCGSCWAVSAVDSMSDRACIRSNGKFNFRFSAANLINCCKKCGKGCRGGTHRSAWKYWVEVGIVSGGPFNSVTTCQPYQFPPCEHHVLGPRPNCSKYSYTPPCRRVCQPKYSVSYKNDLRLGKSAYSIPNNEEAIKTEIYLNGPVQGSMELYQDLYEYKSGVYQHVSGRFIDIHAVRIIGWGIDNETEVPYWLIANSFNYDWGENGFFKIKRGSNECSIEEDITAGLPGDYV